MNNNIIIIGTAPQGLFINRLYSKAGYKTIIVTTKKMQVGIVVMVKRCMLIQKRA